MAAGPTGKGVHAQWMRNGVFSPGEETPLPVMWANLLWFAHRVLHPDGR